MHTKKIKSPRLRADEVAAILNCAKSTVWKWAKAASPYFCMKRNISEFGSPYVEVELQDA